MTARLEDSPLVSVTVILKALWSNASSLAIVLREAEDNEAKKGSCPGISYKPKAHPSSYPADKSMAHRKQLLIEEEISLD